MESSPTNRMCITSAVMVGVGTGVGDNAGVTVGVSVSVGVIEGLRDKEPCGVIAGAVACEEATELRGDGVESALRVPSAETTTVGLAVGEDVAVTVLAKPGGEDVAVGEARA